MPRRCFEIEMSAVGEQVNLGVAADDFCEVLAELPLQEAHDLSYALQGEAFAPQLADYGDFGQVLHGVQAAMAFVLRLDYAALVPPLELAGGDAGQLYYFVRWKALVHSGPAMFETFLALNVSNILRWVGSGVNEEFVDGGY